MEKEREEERQDKTREQDEEGGKEGHTALNNDTRDSPLASLGPWRLDAEAGEAAAAASTQCLTPHQDCLYRHVSRPNTSFETLHG